MSFYETRLDAKAELACRSKGEFAADQKQGLAKFVRMFILVFPTRWCRGCVQRKEKEKPSSVQAP